MDNLISTIKEEYKFGDKLHTIKSILEDYKSTDWKKWSNYSNKSYKRNLVYRDNEIEILLLCWKPEQETPIHDHAENGCIVKILEGKLTETIYMKEEQDIHEIEKGEITYLDNSIGIHKIKNNNVCSVSLHIYSPPKK